MKVIGRRPAEPIPDVLPNLPVAEFAKGDYVVLVWNRFAVDPTKPNAAYVYNHFDVLRLQNGKIQEHWILLVAIPEKKQCLQTKQS